jgi:hypothetical protein
MFDLAYELNASVLTDGKPCQHALDSAEALLRIAFPGTVPGERWPSIGEGVYERVLQTQEYSPSAMYAFAAEVRQGD